MTRINYALSVLLALCLLAFAPAHATDANTCGYIKGQGGWYKITDRSGPYAVDGSCNANLVGSGTFSATVTGFAPGASVSPLSVTTSTARTALPAGSVVVVYNSGANPAFVKFGDGSVVATVANDVVPAGGWMAFTVGSNSYIAAITSSSTTTLNLSGGSGLPTGAGGGSGGSSLPAGAATSAKQDTQITSLGTIATNSGTQATAANQTTGNTSLGTIATNTGTLITDMVRSQGVIGAATAPTYMTIGGGVYKSSPLTLTDGQSAALQIDANGYLKVNVTNGASGGTSSNFGSTFPTAGTAAGAEYLVSAPTLSNGQLVALQTDVNGNLKVNVTNSNSNGQATSANSNPVVLASDQSAVPVAAQAATTGGASTTGNIAANNTTAVVIKASAGTLYGVQLAGLGSAPAYLKIYNATSATCGSGTPVKRLMIPAAGTPANGAGSNITFGPAGVAFTTGITYCIVTGIADNDNTAPAASTFLINLDWK